MHREDDLIDTTEMYLRCVMELEEDGVIPLRAPLMLTCASSTSITG